MFTDRDTNLVYPSLLIYFPKNARNILCWEIIRKIGLFDEYDYNLTGNKLQKQQSSFEDAKKDCGSSSKCNKFAAFDSAEQQPRMPAIRRELSLSLSHTRAHIYTQ